MSTIVELSPAQDQAVATSKASFESHETLTDRAWRLLEEEIVLLRLEPGAVVSEALLSQRLHIGRTPVREALQRLAREGLVVVLPRRGIVISDLDVSRQLRLIEVRREIDRLIARLAARRADAEQRALFSSIAQDLDAAALSNDGIALMRIDRMFDTLLQRSARNEFAAATMGLMTGLTRRFWFAHQRSEREVEQMAGLHAAIARAVAAADEEGAMRASDALMDYVQDFMRRTVLA